MKTETPGSTRTLAADPRTSTTGPLSGRRITGVMLGRLVGVVPGARAIVDLDGTVEDGRVIARLAAGLRPGDAGRKVALMFEEGDPARPLVLGLLETRSETETPENLSPFGLEIDGEDVSLTAENRITLRCGKASITLTRAGKVIIRGTYILNRSSGVNRIKGGSVQIN